ncbi:MAG: hypothetical protein FWE11_04965 [Defluviitaleaceae bacterium]|nr:hypothetical protein [Defluviitaleaceae bacterium]
MIRNFFRTEGAKLKKMNFTEKRQYIWEYYKLHIFVAIIIIFIAGSLINTWFINPPKQEYLYIAWQAPATSIQLNALSEALDPIIGDPDRYRVSISSYMFTGDPQMDQAIVTRFFAMVHVGDLHGVVATKEDMIANVGGDLIKPIHGLLAEIETFDINLFNHVSNHLLHVPITLEDGTTVYDVVGIDLSSSPMIASVGVFVDDLYLGVISNSYHYYEIAKALEILFFGDVIPEVVW